MTEQQSNSPTSNPAFPLSPSAVRLLRAHDAEVERRQATEQRNEADKGKEGNTDKNKDRR